MESGMAAYMDLVFLQRRQMELISKPKRKNMMSISEIRLLLLPELVQELTSRPSTHAVARHWIPLEGISDLRLYAHRTGTYQYCAFPCSLL
jgi:hypothetical protein